MKIPAVLLAGLEMAVNRGLRLDPEAQARFAVMSGKVIGIELRGLDLVFHAAPHAGGVQLLHDFQGNPDAMIRGAPFSLARLGWSPQERGALFSGDVTIEGDVDLARRFDAALRSLDVDWEEQLAQVAGDVLAHQIGNAVRGAVNWGTNTLQAVGRDVAEYLQYESGDLPPPHEVETFLGAMDTLRADVDRLEARVRRAQRRAAGQESS